MQLMTGRVRVFEVMSWCGTIGVITYQRMQGSCRVP